MGNGFGEKLRAERLERGLTQAELGKDLYSPSYISLLETGRREPTAEVIEELARRLELAPKALEAWSQPISVSDAEYVLAGLYARQAWDLRDYPLAATHAATAAQIALEGKNTSAWWNMTYMQAECLIKQGNWQECQKIMQHLLEHPMATESVGLGVRARQMLAGICQGQGQLSTAVDHAMEAVKLCAQLPKGSTLIIGAHRALIGALAESGRLDEAWRYCQDMNDQMDEHSMSQLAGEVAWVIGNVAFMRHDYAGGHQVPRARRQDALPRQRHRTLGPVQQGVRRRAPLLRDRGAGNAVLHRTRRTGPVHRGRQQNGPAGSRLHPRPLALPHRRHRGRRQQAPEIHAESDALAKHTAGEVSLLLGKSLKAAGEAEEALVYLEEAQKAFSAAGASDRVQQALDAVLEIRLAQQRAAQASKAQAS